MTDQVMSTTENIACIKSRVQRITVENATSLSLSSTAASQECAGDCWMQAEFVDSEIRELITETCISKIHPGEDNG